MTTVGEANESLLRLYSGMFRQILLHRVDPRREKQN